MILPAPAPVPEPVPRAASSLALTVIAIIAVGVTLHFGRVFFLPLCVATYLALVFRPAVRWLADRKLPQPIGAALVVLTFLGGLGGLAYWASAPVQQAVAELPETMNEASRTLQRFRRPVERVVQAADELGTAVAPTTSNDVQRVELSTPRLGRVALDVTQNVLIGAVEVVALLFVMLASGGMFLDQLARLLPEFRRKEVAIALAQDLQTSFARYLATFALVNVCFGLSVGLALWLLDLPHAALWGVMAAFTEFVPFLGAVALIAGATLSALVNFDSTSHILAVPLVISTLNLLVENVMVPFVFGRRFTLQPVVVLLSVLFWYWVWGVPGAFLAVPMLIVAQIASRHIPALAPLGQLVGERRRERRRVVVLGEDPRS